MEVVWCLKLRHFLKKAAEEKQTQSMFSECKDPKITQLRFSIFQGLLEGMSIVWIKIKEPQIEP